MKSKISLLILTLALPGLALAADPAGAVPQSPDSATSVQEAPAGGDAAAESSGTAKAAEASTDAEIKPPKAGAKCVPHKAVKADCFICDPALRDKGRLWCKEHARYEDRCFLCHPEIKEEGRAYCGKHHLYADECFLCRPELKKASKGGTPAPAESNSAPAKSQAPGKG
jgi:hypothetical protein